MANKENIRKWVDALRSGEFEQGTGVLSRDGKFCCLGVVCEVAIKNGLDIDRVEVNEGFVAYDECESFLPSAVMDWIGLDGFNPVFGDAGMYTATYYNDTVGLSFSEIADLIEAKYLNEQG